MRRKFAATYAIFCTLLMFAGFILVFFFAWQAGTGEIIGSLCGMLLGFIFAPIVHELGHLCFGKAADMESVYVKAFCFKNTLKRGKRRLSFASPFAADQTQMVPKKGGNMRRRALAYTAGGLVYSGIFLLFALVFSLLNGNFVAWGSVPYAGYLFFLNLLPVEYVSGKTDALVFRGIRKGAPAEACMVAAMEIQGQLAEGKGFGEIEKGLYFDLPQLAEEEPMYAVLLDLRYRYYLDTENIEGVADCLNRLAQAQAYLPDYELEKLAAEFVYLHALRGDREGAEESGKLCRNFLQNGEGSAKRILAAYSAAFGKKEEAKLLKEQAKIALEYERLDGVKKLEERLLERIKTDD